MSRVNLHVRTRWVRQVDDARGLERAGRERLSFDAELWRRAIATPPPPPRKSHEIEAAVRMRLLASCPRRSTSRPTASLCWTG